MRLRFIWIDCSSYRCIESSTVETVAVALTLNSRRIVTYRLHDQVGAFQLLVLLMHLDLKMMRFQHGSTLVSWQMDCSVVGHQMTLLELGGCGCLQCRSFLLGEWQSFHPAFGVAWLLNAAAPTTTCSKSRLPIGSLSGRHGRLLRCGV